jgi:serine/threonine protein kinase
LQEIYPRAILWSTLAHRNILPFLGIFLLPPSLNPAMVSEFMSNGTLVDYLNKHPDSDRVHLVLLVPPMLLCKGLINPSSCQE